MFIFLLQPFSFKKSCKAIQKVFPKSLSGIYEIQPRENGPVLKVYCDMGFSNGGWTFLSRSAIRKGVDQRDINAIFKDRREVLLRVQKADGTQPYTVIKQLTDNQKQVLGLRLNNFQGYTSPQNAATQKFYLLLGILPKSEANQRNTQGFVSNGKGLTFGNCDGNPNSYFAFFPNHFETPSSAYHPNPVYDIRGLAVTWRSTAIRMNSGRTMPNDFIFLTEMHFGGCGCYTSSNRWTRSEPALGTAIGFR